MLRVERKVAVDTLDEDEQFDRGQADGLVNIVWTCQEAGENLLLIRIIIFLFIGSNKIREMVITLGEAASWASSLTRMVMLATKLCLAKFLTLFSMNWMYYTSMYSIHT